MSSTRRVAVAALTALLVVVAGCSAPTGPSQTPAPTEQPTRTETPTASETPTATPTPAVHPPDPPTDRLGWESGYWYNETLTVTAGDGYNRSEIERVVNRTMARLEQIRRLEFNESVSVEVISREEYRSRSVFEFRSSPARDQVWEALFIVGEDTQAATAIKEVYNGSVAGYYAAGRIVLVSKNTSSVELDRTTLAHELTHALQDQHFSFSFNAITKDGRLAGLAISEGEANYVMDRYQDRCESEWSCIPMPTGNASNATINQGVFLTVFLPYSDGPTLVGALYDRGGWEAVADAWQNRPESTEQVIHPERYPDEKPVEVQIEDRSSLAWRPINGGATAGDTVGENGLFAMFWFNDALPKDQLRTGGARYNYSHPITDGWGGDRIVPYRSDDQFGYVFKTAWDTEADAREFLRAYRDLLESKGAERVRTNVYRIPSGPYADAFRVVRRGSTVTIVNGPTVEDLEEIHPAK